MEQLEILAERIRKLRKQRKLTQKEMEYGKVNIPTTTLAFFADYFNVSTDYLLGRTDRRE